GEAAGCGVLDDRTACLAREGIGCEEGALQVEEVVERELLAAVLRQCGEPGSPLLDVERGALSGVLAVTQRLLTLECHGQPLREALAALQCEPRGDRCIVRRRVLEHLRGELAPQL